MVVESGGGAAVGGGGRAGGGESMGRDVWVESGWAGIG